MPKTFEHKDIKEQIRFYQQLFSDLNKGIKYSSECQNDLNVFINTLLKSGFFSELVENDINDVSTNDYSDNYYEILYKIYLFKESSKYKEVCESLIDNYKNKVDVLISDLSSGKNAVYWFFSSKKKKLNTEESYNELLRMRTGTLVSHSKNVLTSIDNLKLTDQRIVVDEFNNNKEKYKKWLEKVNDQFFSNDCVVSLFENYVEKYDSVISKFDEIRDSLQTSVKVIESSIERLKTEELVNSLRGIPVEELARDKSGIKTKYLRDAGYTNLADVFCSSSMQLASVYGISSDKAYTIKDKCDSYAKRVYKELKIKLSYDDKNKYASKVVQSIHIYLNKLEVIRSIDELNKNLGYKLSYSFEQLKNVGNGIIWFFISNSEKDTVVNSFEYVKETLQSQLIPAANAIFNNYNNAIKGEDYWEAFKENSIKFNSVIEGILPDVLGNDDAIYGLPKDLAKEIQEECFFPDGLLSPLRKYQEWGVKYILHQEKVLLGDEMGLGKTVQAIATMVSLKNTGATHFLVVCPASVVTNWCREVTKHSKLRVTKIHGQHKKDSFNSWLKTGGVAVTNFESTTSIKLDDNYKFSMLVVDEAHYIKNEGARRSVCTRELALHAERLLFMTGTALENKVDEMITLIDVLRPSIADQIKYYAFMSSAPQFREKIAPVYYRRKREDVLQELPDKTESEEWCSLNREEEYVYEEAILNGRYPEARRVSWSVDDLSKSSKAQRLKEIVEEAESEGRKVLVFSFFLDTITKIHEFLNGKCLNPINGSVNINRRQEIIDEFDRSPAGTVLLAQINSGGTGLNIQSASVVIICEPQFKPSIENQAISRAYRMGQARNVLVYRLLCENTIDEKLMSVLEEKQKIFEAFADKSIAAEQNEGVDAKRFGELINEEIERINEKRGVPSDASKDVRQLAIKPKAVELRKFEYKPIVVNETGAEYYIKIMKMDYYELVQFLINKYGVVKYDYFTSEYCCSKNSRNSRTDEGLYCHHIDENIIAKLSDEKVARENAFEYQKADRLVYCNLLEHFLLHILIVESSEDKSLGIGGIVDYMARQLNDIYNGVKYAMPWMRNVANVVCNDYDSYIIMLKRIWEDIRKDSLLCSFIEKEDLAKGYNDNIYYNILDTL